MNEIKLLPCPFCGGEAEIQYGACDYNVFQVVCNTEECQAMVGWADNKYDAAKAWNRRAYDDKIC